MRRALPTRPMRTFTPGLLQSEGCGPGPARRSADGGGGRWSVGSDCTDRSAIGQTYSED